MLKLFIVSILAVIFILKDTESLMCNYGSESNMFNLSSKNDDVCVMKFYSTETKNFAMFLGQKGKPPRGVELHPTQPACMIMPDGRGVFVIACYCNTTKCNNLELLQRVRGPE